MIGSNPRVSAIRLPRGRLAKYLAFGLTVLCLRAYASWTSPLAAPSAEPVTLAAGSGLPGAAPPPSTDAAAEQEIRFYEDRLKRDPEDHVAANGLATRYLSRLRETGNVKYLDLAFRTARASLASVPEEANLGGLTVLTQAEHATHNFAAARDHARRLIRLDAGKSLPYALLGDALLELGEYEEATEAFRQMAARGGDSVATQTRLARLASLRGETESARGHLFKALAFALDAPTPPRETIAWCRWQFGESAFAVGDFATAEQHYRDALTTFPGYYNALASLGRVRAANGDLPGAIEQYEQVVLRLPDPTFVAALGDVYALAGRAQDAAAQYQLVEHIARLGELNGALYNRQLALFYADHDLKPDEAYANALREYEARRDVYGADAVAWTALKAGRLPEAQTAIKEALRLGTRDARFFYHAGMIARAAGDEASARDYLQGALALNPQFDPLQAALAREVLGAHPGL